jgi:hypothetical protein
MNKSPLLPAVSLLVLISCHTSADDKLPEIADQYCHCFSSLERSLSTPSKRILKMAANGATEEDLQEERDELSDAQLKRLKTDMEKITGIEDKESTIYQCINQVDKKISGYRTKDKRKFISKLVSEMEKNDRCEVGSYIFRAGQKVMNEDRNKGSD